MNSRIAILIFLASLAIGSPGRCQTKRAGSLRTVITEISADSLRSLADSNPDTPVEEPIVSADIAAVKTARIVAIPDSIVLVVGRPVFLPELFKALAYDALGNRLAGFVPSVAMDDPSLFRRDGFNTVGVNEGVTLLRIRPMYFHPEYRGSTAEATVRVYVRSR